MRALVVTILIFMALPAFAAEEGACQDNETLIGLAKALIKIETENDYRAKYFCYAEEDRRELLSSSFQTFSTVSVMGDMLANAKAKAEDRQPSKLAQLMQRWNLAEDGQASSINTDKLYDQVSDRAGFYHDIMTTLYSYAPGANTTPCVYAPREEAEHSGLLNMSCLKKDDSISTSVIPAQRYDTGWYLRHAKKEDR